MTTILVTGAQGFIGKNLVEWLVRRPDTNILRFDVADDEASLQAGLDVADVVFHLAGVNRPKDESEFVTGNAGLTALVVGRLLRRERKPVLVLSSSTQALLDNPYGRSKRASESSVEEYGAKGGAAVVYRLPNVFGKWSRPQYNSVVATFCHHIARNMEITLHDAAREIDLVYIDDVVRSFVGLLAEPVEPGVRHPEVRPVTRITVGGLAAEIYAMRDIRTRLELPDFENRFRQALYATYLSFLPADAFAYTLTKREDNRGSLAELLKSRHSGQIFVSRTKPGFIRGNHYHNTKVEKFCVLEGTAIIRFRHLVTNEIITYEVRGEEYRVVDIPPGYTHSIENAGTGELIVLFWASEMFDPDNPDTYAAPVR